MSTAANYRLGGFYGILTALLLATQEPFSSQAARQLPHELFVGITQVALLLAIPLMLARAKSRRDFVAVFADRGNIPKLGGILALGLCGLLLYDFGLAGAHPIVVAGILNLSPFWAALVALVVSGKPVPISPAVFFPCFLIAFAGAMTIALSQMNGVGGVDWTAVFRDPLHNSWIFAIPIPVFFALNGSLVGEWFGKYDEQAAIAANFLVSTCVLIPVTLFLARGTALGALATANWLGVALLVVGTLASAVAGRVCYQLALTATGNDNGFVSMFFLLVPALTALVSVPLSMFVTDLKFSANTAFFTGLALIAASLAFFSLMSWRQGRAG